MNCPQSATINTKNLIALFLITLLVIGCNAHHKDLSVNEDLNTAGKRLDLDSPSNTENNQEKPTIRDGAVNAQIGRYTTILAKPTLEQQDPMQVIIEVSIPADIQTVGQATGYLLLRSGYHLKPGIIHKSEVKRLFDQPLPQVHRKLGPMTLQDALLTLGGSAFEMVVNPVERTVSYRLITDSK